MGIREDFFNAVHAADEAGARSLLQRHGLNPNLLERTGPVGGTPALGLAVRFGMHALAGDLIARGADVNLYGDGVAPIHMAADPLSVELLVAGGADVNAPWRRDGVDMSRGTTALHSAARNDKPEMIEALLKAGADPNVRDKEGFAPLHYAASRSEVVARQLVKAGALPSVKTNTGLAAREILEMHQPGFAAEIRAGNARLANTLLNAGAQPNAVGTGPAEKPSPRTTPLHLAAMDGNAEMAALLLEHGANVNAIDGRGLAPVHYATGQSRELLDVLVSGGADLQLKTPAGKTAKELLDEFGPDLRRASDVKQVGLAEQDINFAVNRAAANMDRATDLRTAVPVPTAVTAAVDQKPATAPSGAAVSSVPAKVEEEVSILRDGAVKKEAQAEDEGLVIREAPGATQAQTAEKSAAKKNESKPKSLLGGQFVGNEKGEYSRVGEKRVALVDAGGQIELKDREADTVTAGLELAKAKGWTSIEVGGGTRFRREAWLSASEAGLAVIGYEPTPKDREELQRRLQASKGGTVKNASAEQTPAATPSDAIVTSLAQAQDAVLAAGKNFVEANTRDGMYGSKVFGETPHHVLVTVDGRAKTATAIEKSKLSGIEFGVGKMLKVQFKDGQAMALSKTQGKKLSMSH